MNTKSKSV